MRRHDREFINTRVRFQKLSDSKIHTGWVEDLANPYFAIRSSFDGYAIGDKYLFELFGEMANVIFIGTLENVDGLQALKRIQAEPAEPRSKPTPPPAKGKKWTRASDEEDENPFCADLDITFEFKIISELRYTAPKEAVRKAVQSLTATVATVKGEQDVSVSDISANGAGILSAERFEPGATARLTMTAMMRTISLECTVKHCRQDRQMKGMFRTGLKFENMNRVDMVAWSKVLEAA